MGFFFSRPRRGRHLAVLTMLTCQFMALAAPSAAFAAPATAPSDAPGGLRVVIDAGHGGSDPGALSPFLPLQEKDVTLRVALLTGAALQRRGVEVAYTRTDDRDVPLAARAALAPRSGAQALVSFHLNSASSPGVGGAEVWYGATKGSADLAGALLAALAPPLRATGIGVRGTREGFDLAVLRTPVPAALIELGYVTNPTEAAALNRDSVLAASADAAATAIVNFLQTYHPQPSSGANLASLAGLYFVQPGDTLAAIASRLGLPVEQLARVNPTSIVKALLPGQPLQVPAAAAPASNPPTVAPAGTPPRLVSARATASGATTSLTTYTVRPGETLSEIAARLGRPVGELAQLNGIADPSLVLAGQTLRLPGGASAAPAGANTSARGTSGSSASGRRYTVQPGDTLSEVAQRLGMNAQALALANGIGDPNRLLAGAVLVTPGP